MHKLTRTYVRPRIVSSILIVIIALATVVPTGVMLMNSFKSDAEMYVNPAGIPRDLTLESYKTLFTYYPNVVKAELNSIIISSMSTLIALSMCCLAAFAFAKITFPGSSFLFGLLLTMIMIPPEIVIPGRYIMFARIGMINTYAVQIIPTIAPIIGLFLIRQYMKDIPDSLIESAEVDGARLSRIFISIIVPMSKPVIAAYAILHFLGVWNYYPWPMMVATKASIQPIVVALPSLVDPIVGFLPVWGTIMAGCTLATLPFIILYIRFQESIISGVVAGAIKG